MRLIKTTRCLFTIIVSVVFSSNLFAGVITSANSVLNAPATIGGFSFDLTIDQSGLTTGYVSGVTDFSSYVAGDPRHVASNGPQNYAASSVIPPNAVVDYDLGASLSILQLAFWQYPFFTSGPILDFQVFTSNDSSFGISTLAGSFTAIKDGTGLGGAGTGVQVFNLVDTTARYVRLDVLTTDNSNGFGWSEVAFDIGDGSGTIPSPATLPLLFIGLAAIGWLRRKAWQYS